MRVKVLGPVVVAGQVDVQQRARTVLAALVVRSTLTTDGLAQALGATSRRRRTGR